MTATRRGGAAQRRRQAAGAGAIIGMAVAVQRHDRVDEPATPTGWGWRVDANFSTAVEP
jgi:hypothetical protein